MINKFKELLKHLIEIEEFYPADSANPSILLAVSGGIDSMCMAHLFNRIYYSNYAIATVNFSLRGEESDGDEELVRNWAAGKGIKCFSKTFDTSTFAKEMNLSTQMAARNLRYSWFDELIKEHGFDYVAIAHNLNDSVETFFINILRGTGIRGLTGIPEKNGNIIRPLLSFTRREIAEYTKREEIPFREDSSNRESEYSRNRLRNMVFPEFELINQSFLKTVERDMENIEAVSDIIDQLFEERRNEFFDKENMRISIKALLKEKRPSFWLYMLLNEFGFNPLQVEQVYNSLRGQPGKEFHSDSYLLLKDRNYLLLYPKGIVAESEPNRKLPVNELIEDRDEITGDKSTFIEKVEAGRAVEVDFGSLKLSFSVYNKPSGFKIRKEEDKRGCTGDLFASATSFSILEGRLILDYDLLQYPLQLRKWRDGDKFMPLGMIGFKKISDYFIDIKIDKKSKELIPVLLTGDNIAAIPGFRIDERFKVTNNTKNILEISLI